MTEHEEQEGLGSIAIVGMAGRFPGAGSVEELWRRLRDGEELIRFFSEEELLESGVPPAVFKDPNYVPAHGYLEGIDQFDAGFFDVNPREADITDPQIRLFLENSWAALEDAGIDPERHGGAIAVFAGCSNNAYVFENLIKNPKMIEAVGYTAAALGNHTDFLATRASYKLDLRGPSVTLQTACSTSLVATHLACQSLLSGESDVALAGGVCVTVLKKQGYTYVEGGTNTDDGHVRAFDAGGDGMLGGNAVAMVVLKRLEDAIADGDTIRAVIRGTAINNDGVDKVTFTAPSVNGQAQVILDALEVADVDPRTIGCVEAHGTATPLGDPIEIAALTQAWREKTEDVGFCRIGTLKTNIGHTDIAAGVSGLIKAALELRHGEIVPSLHYETPNPEIDFEASPFVVNTELFSWPAPADHPRRAAVSSFGMGGTNAHAILEEAPELAPTSGGRARRLLLLSGRSPAALEANTAELADHLEAGPEQDLEDVAFTLQVGRKAFEERRAVVVGERADAVAALRKLDALHSVTETCTRKGRGLAFMFTGQGAQYPGMMRGLYAGEPVFREELDRCCELLVDPVGLDLRTLILPPPGEEDAASERLALTQYTQPALFCVEYALARLWMSWGVEPEAMAGHSIGEYVAACLAGVFSLEDGLRLVASRGRLIGSLPEGGAMMAVHLDEEALRPQLPEGLSVAAINAPGLVVVSGAAVAIDALESKLEAENVSTRRLHTSHAFHSILMEPILEAFAREVAKVELHPPSIPVVSCATGTWLGDAQATDPNYWVGHVRDAVRFADCVGTLTDDPDRVLLEVGPGQTLSSLAQLTTAGRDTIVLSSTRHPREDRDDLEVLLLALGKLWTVGVDVDWDAFHGGETRRRVPLPTYAFQRQRYWVDPLETSESAWSGPARKRTHVARWFYVPAWERSVPPARLPRAVREEGPSCTLVFADDSGVAAAVTAALADSPGEVFTVRAGPGYAAPDEHSYVLDPTSAEDYRTLMGDLRNRGKAPAEILHLWGIDDAGDARAEAQRSFYGLLYLAQSLSILPHDDGLRVLVATRGMQDVLGGELTAPEKALLLGPAKAITAELNGVVCRCVDVAADATTPAASERAARWLIDEVGSSAVDLAVAYRGAHRWTLGYREVPLEELEGGPASLREGGSYLVTGGLGGVGLALARMLAERARAKLTLVGRSPLPDRGAWDAWIAEHGEEDASSRKIARVRELEELGAEVLSVAADVCDAASLEAAVAAAVERFGAVHGAIHAAGLAGAGILELKTAEVAGRVLAPKVEGTRNLEAALAGQELDFLVLCSSISSAILDVGQVDYTAANAYLDAFAQHRRNAGTPVVAVNWDAWQEVGMAVETEIPEAMRAARDANLALGIAPAEGRDALGRILDSELTQVVVSPRDLPRRIAEHLEGLVTADVTEEEILAEATVAKRATHARPALSTDYLAPETETERQIAEVWADLLGIDKVGTRDNFFELGGNSLVMMQLNVRLRSLFGISLPVRALFETPDVGSVSERIETLRVLSAAPEEDESREESEEFTL